MIILLQKKGERRMKNNNKGITLIALIITILVIVTLAVITFYSLNGNKIINYANKASQNTKDAFNIEGIKEGFLLAKGYQKNGKMTAEDLQNSLDMVFEEGYAEAIEVVGNFIVKIGENYYELDSYSLFE